MLPDLLAGADIAAVLVRLSREGDESVVVVEQRGLPMDLLWAYAAVLQIHVEDLGATFSGEPRPDTAHSAARRPQV